LPAKPGKVLPEKTKKICAIFAMVLPRKRHGAVVEPDGVLSADQRGAKHPIFKGALAKRPGDARVLVNGERWTLHSLYDLDEFCRITKLRAAVQTSSPKPFRALTWRWC